MGVVAGDEQSSKWEASRYGLPQDSKFQTVESASRVITVTLLQLESRERTKISVYNSSFVYQWVDLPDGTCRNW